jgi:hypothetical protein
MFVNCYGGCGQIIDVKPGGPGRCPDCQRKKDEEDGQRIYEAAMTSPARNKNIEMWGWQSLDRRTKVSYSPHNTLVKKGWSVTVIAPGCYVTPGGIFDSEEEAGRLVASLYEQFTKLDRGRQESEHLKMIMAIHALPG